MKGLLGEQLNPVIVWKTGHTSLQGGSMMVCGLNNSSWTLLLKLKEYSSTTEYIYSRYFHVHLLVWILSWTNMDLFKNNFYSLWKFYFWQAEKASGSIYNIMGDNPDRWFCSVGQQVYVYVKYGILLSCTSKKLTFALVQAYSGIAQCPSYDFMFFN